MNTNDSRRKKESNPVPRALIEVMSMCNFDDSDGYTVVSSSRRECQTALTDCNCPDATHRGVICKHSRHLAFELGEAVVPSTIERARSTTSSANTSRTRTSGSPRTLRTSRQPPACNLSKSGTQHSQGPGGDCYAHEVVAHRDTSDD